MDAEEAREVLGGLDGASVQMGRNWIFLNFSGLARLELSEFPEEHDDFHVVRIVTRQVEQDGHIFLKNGDSQEEVDKKLNREPNAGTTVRLEKGRMNLHFDGHALADMDLAL